MDGSARKVWYRISHKGCRIKWSSGPYEKKRDAKKEIERTFGRLIEIECPGCAVMGRMEDFTIEEYHRG